VPVQYSYTSTPLSACTVQLYLYSPYGPYGLYRISVPVQYSYTSTPPMGRTFCTEPQCLYSTAIPLLPLWAVRSVQNLGACTRVHFQLQHHVKRNLCFIHVATCFGLSQSITGPLQHKMSGIIQLNVKNIVFTFLFLWIPQELNASTISLTCKCIIPVILSCKVPMMD